MFATVQFSRHTCLSIAPRFLDGHSTNHIKTWQRPRNAHRRGCLPPRRTRRKRFPVASVMCGAGSPALRCERSPLGTSISAEFRASRSRRFMSWRFDAGLKEILTPNSRGFDHRFNGKFKIEFEGVSVGRSWSLRVRFVPKGARQAWQRLSRLLRWQLRRRDPCTVELQALARLSGVPILLR